MAPAGGDEPPGIPLIIFSIPIYLIYQQLALLDTRFGLALILCLVNLPLVLVLLANAVRDLPFEIEEEQRGWMEPPPSRSCA